jgi:preprotein translocase subunit Sec61beta
MTGESGSITAAGLISLSKESEVTGIGIETGTVTVIAIETTARIGATIKGQTNLK